MPSARRWVPLSAIVAGAAIGVGAGCGGGPQPPELHGDRLSDSLELAEAQAGAVAWYILAGIAHGVTHGGSVVQPRGLDAGRLTSPAGASLHGAAASPSVHIVVTLRG